MNDVVRKKLCGLLKEHGSCLVRQRSRLLGYLMDQPGYKDMEPQIRNLEKCYVHGIVDELNETSFPVGIRAIITRLRQRLIDKEGTDRELALWAVESWALALGSITEDQLHGSFEVPEKPEPKEDLSDGVVTEEYGHKFRKGICQNCLCELGGLASFLQVPCCKTQTHLRTSSSWRFDEGTFFDS